MVDVVVVQWDVPNGANGWNCAQWGWLSSAQWGGKIEPDGAGRNHQIGWNRGVGNFINQEFGIAQSQKRLKWSGFSKGSCRVGFNI